MDVGNGTKNNMGENRGEDNFEEEIDLDATQLSPIIVEEFVNESEVLKEYEFRNYLFSGLNIPLGMQCILESLFVLYINSKPYGNLLISEFSSFVLDKIAGYFNDANDPEFPKPLSESMISLTLESGVHDRLDEIMTRHLANMSIAEVSQIINNLKSNYILINGGYDPYETARLSAEDTQEFQAVKPFTFTVLDFDKIATGGALNFGFTKFLSSYISRYDLEREDDAGFKRVDFAEFEALIIQDFVDARTTIEERFEKLKDGADQSETAQNLLRYRIVTDLIPKIYFPANQESPDAAYAFIFELLTMYPQMLEEEFRKLEQLLQQQVIVHTPKEMLDSTLRQMDGFANFRYTMESTYDRNYSMSQTFLTILNWIDTSSQPNLGYYFMYVYVCYKALLNVDIEEGIVTESIWDFEATALVDLYEKAIEEDPKNWVKIAYESFRDEAFVYLNGAREFGHIDNDMFVRISDGLKHFQTMFMERMKVLMET